MTPSFVRYDELRTSIRSPARNRRKPTNAVHRASFNLDDPQRLHLERGRSGFRQQLAEFHQALDALLAMLGSGYAEPAVLTRFEQAQQGLNPLLGPETVSLPLTTLISTSLPAMAMIHRLKASHPGCNLVFHPIKKSHFHQRKSQHFFTRLGQVKP